MALRADAVFEGGGIKGIGLVGALEAMEDAGYRWRMVAGTSAGAIVAALVAAGHRAAELRAILEPLDYRRFRDAGFVDRIPLLGPAASVLFEKGIYEGAALEAWLRELLRRKGVRTFGDLRAPAGSLYRHRLQVLVTDLTEGRILVAPSGLPHYGIDPDRFDVAHAVRMSACLPFFFEPVVEAGHHLVDGGLLSNFPVWLFDRPPRAGARAEPAPRWPTFGFKLIEPEHGQPVEIDSIFDFVRAIVNTMLDRQDEQHVEDLDYLRTIGIPTLGVRTTDFGISAARRAALLESGRASARTFLRKWDPERYVARARVPATRKGRAERAEYRERVAARSARIIGARAYRG